MRKSLPRNLDRFKYFAPEQLAVIPEGYSAPLRVITSYELILEQQEKDKLKHDQSQPWCW